MTRKLARSHSSNVLGVKKPGAGEHRVRLRRVRVIKRHREVVGVSGERCQGEVVEVHMTYVLWGLEAAELDLIFQ